MSAKKTKEFTLAVQIAGSINKSFNKSLTTASTSLSGFQKKVNSLNSSFNTLDKGFSKVMTFGKKAFTAVASSAAVATAAVVAAGAASIKVGKEFETAFAGVKKTVEATEEEYAKLRDDILEMSKTIPSTAVEIAGVMEIAGQLGIANSYLTEFTKTMINLGVSTNMTAADAATALAKFANITQMDPSDYERLGSTIVDLGNNFATTEAEIVEMATRLAAAGELAGLTEPQILALATSMSSVGIAAESGGSTMSKLLKKIQVAVETNSESLGQWATVANMSTKEFKEAFEKDAVVALSAFIDGLNDTERLGKSAIVVLDEMELKEVRLSNTILSLANSSGNMTDAIAVANKAWQENTALAEEAGKRYETTDSKIQLMKNSFVGLGIAAYDELQGPFRTVLDNITKWVQGATEYISGPNGVSKWIYNFSVGMPTAIRKVKGAISAFMKVFQPFIDVAKWLWDHPDVLSAVFVGLGTALITYKIASTLTHIVAGLTALASNPVALAIMGITTAVGALGGALFYTKKQNEKLIRARIDEAFGNIALSMEDIEEVANHLLDSDGALTRLHDTIEEFSELDTMQDSINSAMRTINKMNWKVSIGMTLSDDDATEYKDSIASYVSDVQNYMTQQQYALTLAVRLGYDENDPMGNSIMDSINQFYTDNLTTIQGIGTKLNEAITEAFTDGLLDIDEAKEIQELLQQMSDIQSAISKSNFDAALTSLSLDYDIGSGADLNFDAFQNLQEEIDNKLAEFKAENDEARDKLIQNAALRYNQGYLTKAQYDAEVASIAKQFAELYAEKQAAAADFITQTIIDTGVIEQGYKDTYQAVYDAINTMSPDLLADGIEEYTAEGIASMLSGLYEAAEAHGMSKLKEVQGAIDEMLKASKPTYDSLYEQQEYFKSIGKEVPEYITKGINDYEKLLELRDAAGVPGQMVYDIISKDENFSYINEALEESGRSFDAFMASGITGNKGVVTDAINEVMNGVYAQIAKKFNLKLGFGYQPGSGLHDPLGLGDKLTGHADGGIFTVPHIAAFAEEGPEAAIPLDGSANAISLWERTGKLLGMGSVLDGLSLGGGSTQSIEYKPTLIFQGQAPSQSDLESAMRTSQDEFEMMMNRYLKEHRRVAF